MALIDLHCHLDLYPNPQAVARQAAKEGVYVLSVTTTPSAFAGTAALAPPGSRIRTALGLHPELAAGRQHEVAVFKRLLPTVQYVGEVGLDGSAPHRDTLETQADVLREILDACAAEGGRTISLHSRGATDDLLDLLEFEPNAGRFILHWFLARPAAIARAIGLGCWFSVGPAMLASKKGRECVERMPADRLLPETDGPFGTYEGKTLLPGGSGRVYSQLAEMWQWTGREVERQLTSNFRKMSELTKSDAHGPER